MSDEEPVVVATVIGQPIYAAEVQSVVAALPRHESMPSQQRARIEAEALKQLVERRLVVNYLRRLGEAISVHHVDAAVSELQAKLTTQNRTLDDYLKSKGMTEAALRADIDWRMSWESYINRRITDKVLEQYFDGHRADYDGRRVRVQHILLRKPSTDEDSQRRQELVAEAVKILERIIAGQLSFGDAVKRYSEAPSKSKGGDVGELERHGPMVEPFLAAAFQLQPGEISPPVLTPFGIHLIRCSEIKPGKDKWTDVADELRSAVIQRGFKSIVSTERQRAEVTFTGQSPYFDPETRELVVPEKTTDHGRDQQGHD